MSIYFTSNRRHETQHARRAGEQEMQMPAHILRHARQLFAQVLAFNFENEVTGDMCERSLCVITHTPAKTYRCPPDGVYVRAYGVPGSVFCLQVNWFTFVILVPGNFSFHTYLRKTEADGATLSWPRVTRCLKRRCLTQIVLCKLWLVWLSEPFNWRQLLLSRPITPVSWGNKIHSNDSMKSLPRYFVVLKLCLI